VEANVEGEKVKSRMSQFEGRDKLTALMEEKEKTEATETARRKRQLESDDRKRILKEIEDDKRRRQAFGKAPTTAAQPTVATPASSVPAAAAVAPTAATGAPVPKETMIQLRLTDGKVLRKQFPVEAKIDDVKKFAAQSGEPCAAFYLVQPFPRVSFEGRSGTLLEAGLVPNASLVVTKAAAETPQVAVPLLLPEKGKAEKETPEAEEPEDQGDEGSDGEEKLPGVPYSPLVSGKGKGKAHPWGAGNHLSNGGQNSAAQDRLFLDDMRKRRENFLTRPQEPIAGPSSDPIPDMPLQPGPMETDPLVDENASRAAAEHRNLMVAASLRRMEAAEPAFSGDNQRRRGGGRAVTISTLEDLTVTVVAELMVSGKNLNPIKSLRGLSAGVGDKIMRYLLRKDKLDKFSLSKLAVWYFPLIIVVVIATFIYFLSVSFSALQLPDRHAFGRVPVFYQCLVDGCWQALQPHLTLFAVIPVHHGQGHCRT